MYQFSSSNQFKNFIQLKLLYQFLLVIFFVRDLSFVIIIISRSLVLTNGLKFFLLSNSKDRLIVLPHQLNFDPFSFTCSKRGVKEPNNQMLFISIAHIYLIYIFYISCDIFLKFSLT